MTVLAKASNNLIDRQNESSVRQSPAGKDVKTEAEKSTFFFGSRNLATASEDKLRSLSVCCSEKSST
jgi:hypothetical protein